MRDYCWAIERGLEKAQVMEEIDLDLMQTELDDASDSAEEAIKLIEDGVRSGKIEDILASDLISSLQYILYWIKTITSLFGWRDPSFLPSRDDQC